MAVEARHLNLCAPQILGNSRDMMMNNVEGHGNVFDASLGFGVVATFSGKTTAMENHVVPMFGSAINETAPTKTVAMRSDSGVTCAVPVSRKRSRGAMNPVVPPFPSVVQDQTAYNRCGSFTFLGEDMSYQIQQQQMEIDRFITQHTEKVQREIQERRKKYSRRIAAAMEENVMKKLKAKEEEINKIGKLNFALEEKIKSLYLENQIWRDLAQTNEATANALRSNLEQVLAQIDNAAATTTDAQSCCGSNFDEIDHRTLIANRDNIIRNAPSLEKNNRGNSTSNRICRRCGKEESCVLLLPCRHLCLCTVCGSSLHTCPVCNSTKTASVHVNLRS